MEMEDCLTLDELMLIVNSLRKKEQNDREFAAALKGIDLKGEEEDAETAFERIKRQADADMQGRDETEMFFEELGVDVEVID